MRRGTKNPIGERTRAARTRLGLNQDEVAERVAISPDVYGRLERGTVTPRLATLLKICEVLAVKPNDLLLDDGGESIATDRLSADLRQLVSVLDGADATTIRRVTEVARWLRPAGKTSARGTKRRAPKS